MEAMDWAEIKRRLLDGTSVQILADLNGVTYKTMYNRIMAHQIKDGVTYLTPGNTKGLKKAKAISKTKQAQAKAKEKAAGLPEAVNNSGLTTCEDCANASHRDNQPFCLLGHRYGGKNCVCSDYKTFPELAPEKKPSAPEDPGKLPEGLQPETVQEITYQIELCTQLAERYRKQADDWLRILQAFM